MKSSEERKNVTLTEGFCQDLWDFWVSFWFFQDFARIFWALAWNFGVSLGSFEGFLDFFEKSLGFLGLCKDFLVSFGSFRILQGFFWALAWDFGVFLLSFEGFFCFCVKFRRFLGIFWGFFSFFGKSSGFFGFFGKILGFFGLCKDFLVSFGSFRILQGFFWAFVPNFGVSLSKVWDFLGLCQDFWVFLWFFQDFFEDFRAFVWNFGVSLGSFEGFLGFHDEFSGLCWFLRSFWLFSHFGRNFFCDSSTFWGFFKKDFCVSLSTGIFDVFRDSFGIFGCLALRNVLYFSLHETFSTFFETLSGFVKTFWFFLSLCNSFRNFQWFRILLGSIWLLKGFMGFLETCMGSFWNFGRYF